MFSQPMAPLLKRMVRAPVIELCSHRYIRRLFCWRVTRGERKVALTFDDGPHPEYTPQALDVLAEYGVKATFFVLGELIERSPEIFQRTVDEGHEIGVHGYFHDHRNMPEQALRTLDILSGFGVSTTLYRPPNGILEPSTALWMMKRGFSTVFWSVDGRDSLRHEGKEDSTPNYDVIQSGDIVLLHDDNPICIADLRGILSDLRRKNLETVRISECLGA